MHLRTQIACYELKRYLSPVILKKIFHDSFENFEIYKDLYGKSCKRDWVAKVVFTRDDVVSQRLKFGSAFLSSSWESKIALFF